MFRHQVRLGIKVTFTAVCHCLKPAEHRDCMQEEAQNNGERVPLIITNGIKSLKQNSVIIERDYWLKVMPCICCISHVS